MNYLKKLIKVILESFFKRELEIRYRNSFFPFTEPSLEVDTYCCREKNCLKCHGKEWIELLGGGVIRKEVFSHLKVESKYGIAFGLGLERLAMVEGLIKDCRELYL